jgi:hypothetical protein
MGTADCRFGLSKFAGVITMPETQQIQKILDDAFARFQAEHPEVVQSLEEMNITFADYLQILSGMNDSVQPMSGNAQVQPR